MNQYIQKLVIEKSKHVFEESIRELLLCENYSGGLPKGINVADLGCSCNKRDNKKHS